MPSVMRRYGVGGDITAFTRTIIAHELAHELWNNVVDEDFKQDILARAKNENFNTIYLGPCHIIRYKSHEIPYTT